MASYIKKENRGLLHRELHVPAGKKIPMAKLKAAKRKADRTENSLLKKQVAFAMAARKWKHK